ncbi:MAG: hypothetical protein JJ902_23075 [Roseibium sp.]|nr:hypothetical protein [Roseibium sp.]
MEFRNFVVTLVTVIAGSGIGTAGVQYFSKDRELDIRMVEIGLSILRADPKEDDQISPARTWAIEVVERFSGQAFDDEDKAALINQPIRTLPYTTKFEDVYDMMSKGTGNTTGDEGVFFWTGDPEDLRRNFGVFHPSKIDPTYPPPNSQSAD